MEYFYEIYKETDEDPLKWNIQQFIKFLKVIKEDNMISLFTENSIDGMIFFDLNS